MKGMRSVFFLIFLFFWTMNGFCGLENYFKPAPGKSNQHTMPNIDFIYMINLDQRPQKWEQSLEALKPYGIYPYRFSAVNGWELSLETINDVGVKFTPGMQGGFMGTSYLSPDQFEPSHSLIKQFGKVYFCHCMSRGAIGIVLSHLSILQDAYNSGYETIWVMEDDIQIMRDPREISNIIQRLDNFVGKGKWDILFTDQDTRDSNGNYVPAHGIAQRPNFHPKNTHQYSTRKRVNSEFQKIGARYGAYSMIVRRSGMKAILDFIKSHNIFLPYDMDLYLPSNIRMYTVLQDVVCSLPKALSDNGGPNYLLNK